MNIILVLTLIAILLIIAWAIRGDKIEAASKDQPADQPVIEKDQKDDPDRIFRRREADRRIEDEPDKIFRRRATDRRIENDYPTGESSPAPISENIHDKNTSDDQIELPFSANEIIADGSRFKLYKRTLINSEIYAKRGDFETAISLYSGVKERILDNVIRDKIESNIYYLQNFRQKKEENLKKKIESIYTNPQVLQQQQPTITLNLPEKGLIDTDEIIDRISEQLNNKFSHLTGSDEINELDEQENELSQENKELLKNIQEMKEQIDSLSEIKNTMEALKEKHEEEFAQENNEILRDIKDLKEQIDSLSESKRAMEELNERQKDELSQENKELTKNIQYLMEQIDSLSESKRSMEELKEKQKDELSQENKELQKNIQEMKEQIDSLSDSKRAMEELKEQQRDELAQENNELLKDIQEMKEQIDNLSDIKRSMEELHDKINNPKAPEIPEALKEPVIIQAKYDTPIPVHFDPQPVLDLLDKINQKKKDDELLEKDLPEQNLSDKNLPDQNLADTPANPEEKPENKYGDTAKPEKEVERHYDAKEDPNEFDLLKDMDIPKDESTITDEEIFEKILKNAEKEKNTKDFEIVGDTAPDAPEFSSGDSTSANRSVYDQDFYRKFINTNRVKTKELPVLKVSYDFKKLPDEFSLSREKNILEYSFYKYKPMLQRADEYMKNKHVKDAINYYKVVLDQNIPVEFKAMLRKNIKDLSEYLEKYLASD